MTAIEITTTWATAAEDIARHIGDLLPGDVTVYTHSRSGTAEYALLWLARMGRLRRVIIGESRPGGEGIALARRLASDDNLRTAGTQVTLAADAASGLRMGEVDTLLIGADSVRADGSVVNKVGTYPLALMAHDLGRPVYVLCESLKIASPTWPLTLEAGDPADALTAPIPGVVVDATAFDQTPSRLIGAVVAERGALDHEALTALAQEAQMALASLAGG